MPKVKWEYTRGALLKIMNLPALHNDINSRARRIASAAGEGFEATSKRGGFGGGRAIAFVSANTREAQEAEATDKALSKAISSGK